MFDKYRKNRKGSMAVIGVLMIAITVAIGAVIGLATVALSKDIFDDMSLATAANTAMTNTTNTIYSAWPLSGIAVLAAFGALAIGVFLAYIGYKG